MALDNLNFDENQNLNPEVENNDVVSEAETTMDDDVNNTSSHAGWSEDELLDHTNIEVTIPNDSIPIVVLYGPPSCGKTMTLVRLSRYLNKNHYQITPERTFRPSRDKTYLKLCDDFNDLIDSEYSASSTTNISFMLLTVYKGTKPICRILEAPGELYFNPKDPECEYPPYIHELTNSNNRKVWAFIAEPDWSDDKPREKYVERIDKFLKNKKSRDRYILVYNKVDRTQYLRNGYVDIAEAIKHMKTQYQGIMEPFKNQHPITKLWRKYDCAFVPFTTGNYNKTTDGKEKYTACHDIFVQKLWNAIMKQF